MPTTQTSLIFERGKATTRAVMLSGRPVSDPVVPFGADASTAECDE